MLQSNVMVSSILLGIQSSSKTGNPCLRRLKKAAGFQIPNRRFLLCKRSFNCLVMFKIYDLLSFIACVRTVRVCYPPLRFPLKCSCDRSISQDLGMIFPQTSPASFAVSAVFNISSPQHDLTCLWRLPVDPASFMSRKRCTRPLHCSLQHLNPWARRPSFSTIVGIGLKNA